MKLVITGGAGFIGGNFVNYWVENHPGDSVTVLDSLTYAGNMDRIAKAIDGRKIAFVKGDIQDFGLVKKVFEGVDTVVHFAAETHVDRSLAGLEAEKLFMRTNYEGTITLLHAAREAGIKRFHHVSTDEVFGDLDYGTPEKFHEKFPYNAHNPYAISKAAADFAVRGFARSYGLPFTLSNCTNNYGPYQTPEKVIPRSITLLLNNEKVQLYTDAAGVAGPNIRDWLHVEDHCRAIESIILKGKTGETYCVGGNSELTNHELVRKMLGLMADITGKRFTMESHVSLVKDRPGHDRRYAMDISKINRDLGWAPRHSFESGFRATVEWYMSETGRAWLSAQEKSTADVRVGQGNIRKNASLFRGGKPRVHKELKKTEPLAEIVGSLNLGGTSRIASKLTSIKRFSPAGARNMEITNIPSFVNPNQHFVRGEHSRRARRKVKNGGSTPHV